MKGPTTRRGRFNLRKFKYMKRRRRNYSHYHLDHDYLSHFRCVYAYYGRFFRSGDGYQQPLNALLVRPKNGVPWLTTVSPNYTVPPVGYKRPPHPHFNPPLETLLPYHQSKVVLGYNNRRVKYQGHKLGRLNGFQRGVWAANKVNWSWIQGRGQSYYPEWDPLHRTPVLPAGFPLWPHDRIHCKLVPKP